MSKLINNVALEKKLGQPQNLDPHQLTFEGFFGNLCSPHFAKFHTQFCVKNLKMERKEDKGFLTFWSGDSNPRFLVIFLSCPFEFS